MKDDLIRYSVCVREVCDVFYTVYAENEDEILQEKDRSNWDHDYTYYESTEITSIKSE